MIPRRAAIVTDCVRSLAPSLPMMCLHLRDVAVAVALRFDAVEVDLTVRREFRLGERLALQARADLFNLFNHPNFGPRSAQIALKLLF